MRGALCEGGDGRCRKCAAPRRGSGNPGRAAGALIAPTLSSAIYNAVGVRCRKIPIRPQDLLKAIQAKEASGDGG